MPDFDKLKHHVDKLQSLLGDRHPGLSTWVLCAAEHWRAIAEMWDGEEASWSETWPTEPGYYWFYGRAFQRDYNPSLHFAKVYQAVSGLIVTVNRCHIWEDDAEGYWMPVRVLEPPIQRKSKGGKASE